MHYLHYFIYPFLPLNLFNKAVLRARYQHIIRCLGMNSLPRERERTHKRTVRKGCGQLTNREKPAGLLLQGQLKQAEV